MDSQRELQKVMYQAEVFKKQIDGINQQVNMVELTIKSMESTIEALTSLNKTATKTEVLLPLGSNSFARAKLSDNKNVIVGVSMNVLVEKSIPDAIKLFDKNIEELNGALAEMQKKSAEIENQLVNLNNIGEKLIRESQEQGRI